jgi:hypothetical protein
MWRRLRIRQLPEVDSDSDSDSEDSKIFLLKCRFCRAISLEFCRIFALLTGEYPGMGWGAGCVFLVIMAAMISYTHRMKSNLLNMTRTQALGIGLIFRS